MPGDDMNGLADLLPILGASQSLGLLSTLVMGTAINVLIYWERYDELSEITAPGAQYSSNDSATLLLALGNAFATYVIAYSVCEVHYIQALHHAALRHASKARRNAKNQLSTSTGQKKAFESEVTRTGFAYTELISAEEKHDQLVDEVITGFSRFNSMRHMARNAMWMSLVSLTLAVLTILPGDHTDKDHGLDIWGEEELRSGTKAAMIFGFMFIWTMAGFMFSVETPKIFLQLGVVFFLLFIASIAEPLHDTHHPMIKIMSCVVLCLTLVIVAAVVLLFRREFGPLVRSNAEVY
jgi:hypothetical protein